MAGGISWTQPCGEKASGVTLEDQHGVVHVLVIGTVEEAELLLTMGGIVRGVDVEQNLAALANLIPAEADELLAQPVVQSTRSRADGVFSQRLRVGWEPSATPSL